MPEPHKYDCIPPASATITIIPMSAWSHLPSVAIGVLLCSVTYYLLVVARGRNNALLPPGPRKIPFLGNVHMLPAEGQERTFAEWGKRYGNACHVTKDGPNISNIIRSLQAMSYMPSSSGDLRSSPTATIRLMNL